MDLRAATEDGREGEREACRRARRQELWNMTSQPAAMRVSFS
jgi:hypothetical protein